MKRGLGLSIVFLVIVGCQSAPPVVVNETIPPPFVVNGTTVVIEDQRTDWEREPFSGSRTTLHRLNRAHPDPWAQLAKETESMVALLPEKPERVEIVVTSFRLVQKSDKATIRLDPSTNVPIGRESLGGSNTAMNATYDQVRAATMSGSGTTVGKGTIFQNNNVAGSQSGLQSNSQNMAVGGMPPPIMKDNGAPGVLDEHPAGASCRVRASVRLIYPGGKMQSIDVPPALAVGQNSSGTKYMGESLDSAARMAVRQYGVQARYALGLPMD
jgi:hypothetical protein